MKQISVIGTIHLNWTPKDELEKVLTDLQPDQLLIELSPEELKRPRTESIRDEMFIAYDWALLNKVKVAVFDVEEDILNEGITGKEPEFMEHELKSKELLKEYSWKDLNKIEPWQTSEITALEKEIEEKYFDKDKSRRREFQMFENIKEKLVDGQNVIVTGAGHLTFFKEQFPSANLPFRDKKVLGFIPDSDA